MPKKIQTIFKLQRAFLGMFFVSMILFSAGSAKADEAGTPADSATPTSSATPSPSVPGQVLINEMMWSGSSLSTYDEFIELMNTTDQVIDLSGYSIWDETKTGNDSKPMVVISNGQIAPQGKFLIANYSNSDARSIINIAPDVVESSVSLSNENLEISLRDVDGATIDVAGDGSKPFYYSEIMNLKDSSGHNYKASIERSNYAGFDLAKTDVKENWKMASLSLNIKPSVPDGKVVSDLATPENSGRPKLVSFHLAENSYVLNTKYSGEFSFEIMPEEIQKILIEFKTIATSGDLELGPNENTFSLSPSESCYSLKFKFYNFAGLFLEKDIGLSCYTKNPQITFSEILSSPKDHDWDGDGFAGSQDEWFELKNDSTSDTSLTGWRACDKDKNCSQLSGQINSKEFKVYFYKDFKFSLNNDGEELYLYDPGGAVIDHISIPSLGYNISFAKFEGGWKKTSLPTPGAENKLPEVLSSNSDSVASSSVVAQTSEASSEEQQANINNGVDSEVIVEQRIIHATLASYLVTNSTVLPKVDGAVMGSSDQRAKNPFKIRLNLLYFYFALVVLLVGITFYWGLYEIYRRE